MGVDVSVNGPTTLKNTISKWVWFEDNVALEEGAGVCYNWDYGDDATVSDARRRNNVETPSFTNAQHFAGVAARAYTAKTGGRLIEIYVPGSVCLIRLGIGVSTVIGQGLLTFDVTDAVEGQFLRTGMPGEGSALPLQTVTGGAATLTCLAKLQTGPPSGGVEYVEPTDIATWTAALIGGTTLVKGLALGQDCVEDLADGLVEGIKKRIAVVTAAFTGNQLQIDIDGNDGIKLDCVSANLAEVTFNSVGDNVTFEWKQGAWHNLGGIFTAEA